MIGLLRGELISIKEDSMLLDVHGVGYNVFITSKDAAAFSAISDKLTVYTYLSVREDAMKLYGFQSEEALDMFKLLITVNGIGPKAAQSILAIMDTDELRLAIISQDAKAISRCPGIGAKTASRIILDLKDKVSVIEVLNSQSLDTAKNITESPGALDSARKEAVEALTALGFGAAESLKAVKQVPVTEDMDAGEIIGAALAYLG